MKKHLFLKTLLVLIGILIGSVSTQMWADAQYYYRGADNSWGGTLMTVSDDGYYEYKASSTNDHQFKIALSESGWDYNYSYVSAGFNGTNITGIGDQEQDNCKCWYNSGSYYILVYYPNTTINSGSSPKICAATYLPDNRSTTVYYVNSNSWSTPVKAYAWGDPSGSNNGTYGGQDMESTGKKYNGKDIYTITFNKRFANVIFNKNNSTNNDEKTADLTISVDQMYNGSSWIDYIYDVTVTFNNNGRGSTTASQTFLQGGTASEPSDPSATGYNFAGWYEEPACTLAWNFSSTISADKTLYAKWTAKNYSNTLNDQDATGTGHSTSATTTYNSTTVSSITNPEKDYYTFGGWYSAAGGGGMMVINTSGALQASTAYTNSSRQWTSDGAQTLYAKWTQTFDLEGNGAGSSDGSITTTYNSRTITGYSAASRTGYTLAGYYDATSGGNQIVNTSGALVSYSAAVSNYLKSSSGEWIYDDADPVLYAHWTANNYDVTLKANTGTGDDQVVQATYDAAMPTTLKVGGSAVTVHTKTGYNLLGYWDDASSGNQYYSYNVGTSTLSSYRTWNKTSATDLYAHWSAKGYTVTLDIDEDNHGTIASKTTSQSVTYDAATSSVAALPTAAQGYALDGYYTNHAGAGTKLINADGTWIASVTGYTDGSKNWVHDGDVTLYAYYKQAEITGITFTDGAVVAPSTSKTVTAVISPTPTGTTTVCWRVLYSNDNPMDPQPTFSPATAQGNSVSFTSPASSGMYKMEAVLHLGSGCGGTDISTYTANFQVAGDHDVTVQYKDANGTVIAASSTVTGRPLAWSDPITAPEIFGYTFNHWVAGDGVTLSEDGTNALVDGEGDPLDESEVETIYIRAVYDGRLTAVYNQNQLIYFKNTLGWSEVYVNFYTASYWNNPKGSGNNGVTNQNKQMTQIGETDVWYYDYGYNGGGSSITPSLYVSFTSSSQSSAENFWGSGTGVNVVYPANYQDDIHTNKSSENGFKAATPMFVPLKDQVGTTLNQTTTPSVGQANYFNRGYWTKYLSGTGYTLEVYNSAGDALLKSIEFTSADELMPMKAVADLEASTTYKYQIRRGGTESNGIYYGNSGTMTNTNHGQDTPWELTNSPSITMVTIKTTAAGDYTFNLDYSANASLQYRLRVAVDYPAATGDFQVLYSDTTSWSNGQHAASWRHPSRVIAARANGKDTISFFVYKGKQPTLYARSVSSIADGGAITWAAANIGDAASQSVESVTATGVYNFEVVQNAAGTAITAINNLGKYTGNYYIRTDGAPSKWDSYKSPDHMMTYSEYSKEHSDYTHYYMKYVESGTNVKFTIANDYSACISDTLITHTYRGGDAAHITAPAGTINANANIRFMWDIRYNRLIRAYLAEGQNDGSEFLVLRANSNTDMLDKDGNALLNSANSGQAGYNHKAPNNCMQFVDNENWIYEANIKIKPGAFVKLYAKFNGSYFYFKGENNATFDAENAIKLMDGSGDAQLVRVIYDFKTDRLVAAWVPTNATIESDNPINADVMFVREHQGDIAQITFGESGKISKITTAYGVLRLNKYTLNNKDKSTHEPLASPTSPYERSLYWISFPFRVKLSEVFGFGTYGTHWAIQRYDGAARATKGHFLENGSFWTWMDRNTEYLEPNQGYMLSVDVDLMSEDAEDVWGPDSRSSQVELYFPSYGKMPDITDDDVRQKIPAHECTINRAATEGLPDTGNPETSYNRTIFDSHWNVISVPTYVNTDDVTFKNTEWTTAVGPKFLYTWNADDNTITATTASGYTYHAMHAYMVQYADSIIWAAKSGSPYASIVARRHV